MPPCSGATVEMLTFDIVRVGDSAYVPGWIMILVPLPVTVANARVIVLNGRRSVPGLASSPELRDTCISRS